MSAVITLDELMQGQHWFRKIDIGTKVSIQFLSHQNIRIRAELLGFRIGHYILVRYENSDQLPSQLSGYMAVVRFLVEDMVGECLAFKAEVIQATHRPDRILFLTFPDEIHHRPLRHQQRQQTKIPATIRLRGDEGKATREHPGYVVDISAGGCRFMFAEQPEHKRVKQAPVLVEFSDDHSRVPGEVRSVRAENGDMVVGIKFNEAQNDIEKRHSGFISELPRGGKS